MCEKIFKFMKFTFPENALIQGIFTHTHPSSKQQEGVEETDLLYQNLVRKYEDDLKH